MRRAARLRRWIVWAVALAATTGSAPPVRAQIVAPVIDVPYLPQSEDLCGGAAAAMVMRYWGAADVYPDAFAPLIDRSAGGIRTAALMAELERRGWTAIGGAGDVGHMAQELGRGRPVIALIEDRPDRFHYVVVVGRTRGEVILHDPARAPSRGMKTEKFDAAWGKAQNWMLVLLPSPSSPDLARRAGTEDGHGSVAAHGRPESCAGPVGDAVRLAGDGDRVAARRVLESATAMCPTAGAPWREMAGLDALEGNWQAAAAHARRAADLDPSDVYAWRVLASAEYLRNRDMAALAAWNRIDEPTVNLIDIKGLDNIRYGVVEDAMGVHLKETLTPRALRLAERRARDVPAIALARVGFHPLENGVAQLDVSVLERARAPVTYGSWAGIGLRAVTERELATSLASVSGGGEIITGSWRWWEHRPMFAASYAAPAPHAAGGGVWTLDASRETQTFGREPLEETRTRLGFDASNWVSQRTRVHGGVALERWTDRPRDIALNLGAELWPAIDRVAIAVTATRWQGDRAFSALAARFRARSRVQSSGTVWTGSGGYQVASAGSPASVWPGADTGHARDALLRAHPLLDDGVISGGVFGRRLVHGNGELQRWFAVRRWPLRIGAATFVDVARATRGLPETDTRLHVDAGAGLRLAVPGVGVLRLDLARGLRDGHTAFSLGWQVQ
jgi:hypothetical protein